MCFWMSFSVKHAPLEVFQLVSYCRIAFACRGFQLDGINDSNFASADADKTFVLKGAGNEADSDSLDAQHLPHKFRTEKHFVATARIPRTQQPAGEPLTGRLLSPAGRTLLRLAIEATL